MFGSILFGGRWLEGAVCPEAGAGEKVALRTWPALRTSLFLGLAALCWSRSSCLAGAQGAVRSQGWEFPFYPAPCPSAQLCHSLLWVPLSNFLKLFPQLQSVGLEVLTGGGRAVCHVQHLARQDSVMLIWWAERSRSSRTTVQEVSSSVFRSLMSHPRPGIPSSLPVYLNGRSTLLLELETLPSPAACVHTRAPISRSLPHPPLGVQWLEQGRTW